MGKKVLVRTIHSLLNDKNKFVSVQPKFEKNPLGYILWGMIKQKNENDLRRKFIILYAYENKRPCSYGRGSSQVIKDQIDGVKVRSIEKFFSAYCKAINKGK